MDDHMFGDPRFTIGMESAKRVQAMFTCIEINFLPYVTMTEYQHHSNIALTIQHCAYTYSTVIYRIG